MNLWSWRFWLNMWMTASLGWRPWNEANAGECFFRKKPGFQWLIKKSTPLNVASRSGSQVSDLEARFQIWEPGFNKRNPLPRIWLPELGAIFLKFRLSQQTRTFCNNFIEWNALSIYPISVFCECLYAFLAGLKY